MSRTYRKKYVPLTVVNKLDVSDDEIYQAMIYVKTGRNPDGLRWYSRNHALCSTLTALRFRKNITRDGNKSHRNAHAVVNLSKKKIDSKLRVSLKHELRQMRSGNIDWDEHTVCPNKLRAHERACMMYDLF